MSVRPRKCGYGARIPLLILWVLAALASVASGGIDSTVADSVASAGTATKQLLSDGKLQVVSGKGTRWHGMELGAGTGGAGSQRKFGATAEPARETVLFQGPKSDEKVTVVLYTSSGCAACRLYWTTILSRTLQKAGMWGIVDFYVVPWGAGQVQSRTGEELNSSAAILAADPAAIQLDCPGGRGCKGEKYAACIAHMYPRGQDFFPVINCIQGRGCVTGENSPDDCYGTAEEVSQTCVNEWGVGEWGANMNASLVEKCAAGPLGKKLLLENAAATFAADPPFVPWVTVDGHAVSAERGAQGLERLALLGRSICLARQRAGGELPESCGYFPRTLSEIRWQDLPQHSSLRGHDDDGMRGSARGLWSANAIAGLLLTAAAALFLSSTFCVDDAERPDSDVA